MQPGAQAAATQQAAQNLTLNAAGMNWVFSLGGNFGASTFVFTRFEVPEEFEMGLDKHVVVHRLLAEDGTSQIIVHELGNFPLPTSWTGIFFGGTAMQRYLQLETLAAQGGEVLFTYGPYQWIVEIGQCKAKIKHQLEVEYTLQVNVIQSLNTSPPSVLDTSFDTSTQQNYNTAAAAATSYYGLQSQMTQAQIEAILEKQLAPSSAWNLLQTSITSAFPLKNLNFSQLVTLGSQVTSFLSNLGSDVSTLKSQVLNVPGANFMTQGILFSNFLSIFSTQLSGLQGIGLGQTAVTTSWGNLFQLAAQFYPGSSPESAAALIAGANGMTDYFIRTPTTIVLPPLLQ